MYRTGITINPKIVAVTIPPIMGAAMRFITSEPAWPVIRSIEPEPLSGLEKINSFLTFARFSSSDKSGKNYYYHEYKSDEFTQNNSAFETHPHSFLN